MALVKSRSRKIASNLLFYSIYIIVACVFIFPLLYVLGNSFRDSQAIWNNAFPFSPKTFFSLKDFTIEGYLYSLGLTKIAKMQGVGIARNLLISLSSSLCVIIISLICSTGAAYFFSKLPFPRKKILLVLVVATMMIPQQVVTVPLYFVCNALGLVNNFAALVVPWYSSPFVVFLLIQYLEDIPKSLDEAAIVDGASRLQILTLILIPNCIPGILTVFVMEFQFIWNEYFWPLIAISNSKLYPVQVALSCQFTDRAPNWGAVFASMVLASAPIIILFLSSQKYFYQSIAASGIKG